jgi:hypothetical protein
MGANPGRGTNRFSEKTAIGADSPINRRCSEIRGQWARVPRLSGVRSLPSPEFMSPSRRLSATTIFEAARLLAGASNASRLECLGRSGRRLPLDVSGKNPGWDRDAAAAAPCTSDPDIPSDIRDTRSSSLWYLEISLNSGADVPGCTSLQWRIRVTARHPELRLGLSE